MNEDFLSIEAYNRNALSAQVTAAYPALRAFAPTTFSQINFPSLVSDEIDLCRYADIMGQNERCACSIVRSILPICLLAVAALL